MHKSKPTTWIRKCTLEHDNLLDSRGMSAQHRKWIGSRPSEQTDYWTSEIWWGMLECAYKAAFIFCQQNVKYYCKMNNFCCKFLPVFFYQCVFRRRRAFLPWLGCLDPQMNLLLSETAPAAWKCKIGITYVSDRQQQRTDSCRPLVDELPLSRDARSCESFACTLWLSCLNRESAVSLVLAESTGTLSWCNLNSEV